MFELINEVLQALADVGWLSIPIGLVHHDDTLKP